MDTAPSTPGQGTHGGEPGFQDAGSLARMMATSSCPCRIMLVEDEFLVSVLLEGILRAAGYEVLGPFSRLADALAAAQREAVDLALLDVNLAGEMVYPVAEVLSARNVPFMLLTGYGPQAVPEGRSWMVCSKPFEVRTLLSAVDTLRRQIC